MILITSQNFPPDLGGIQTLMGGLAASLAAAGERVAVYADRLRANGANDFHPPYALERFGGIRPWRRRVKARAIAKACRKHPVRGVFADSWKSVELLPALPVPIAVLAHGMEFPLHPSPRKRQRICRALSRAHCVIVNSSFTAERVRAYLANDARQLHVIHPPIDPQPAPSATALADAQRLCAGRSPVLITLARLEPRKGIDRVLRAMPAVLAAHPGVLYIIAGVGADKLRLHAIADALGVQHCVRFTGAVESDTKAALFSVADLFVMPARREGNSVEGFGIVYLEAAWYGVPAIAGSDGGATDAVLDGDTGILCDAISDADVARQILLVLGDPTLRHRLGAAAARRAVEQQWANCLPLYLAALFESNRGTKS
ncbi:MAG: glycosyltransferase family 4 protein [Gammaproteobacteria bacterium]|nr:glycosyltransferase family 4 protein [Gammaproteobacteria bacterium]